MIRKTHDKELDKLIEKLMSPWDAGPSGGDEYVVNADIAHDAALKLIEMFEKLEAWKEYDYNRQRFE
jgi:hypothetical protein